ncbi:hypothetical protein JCM17846_01030 [Iodidimonas nitroreducens]|uniref:Uncharacterized protein n=1 Tax=Iodidimonas nitroreducens TaxID=1236968 RepID=A0A5A7N2B1_9PROT|nr:hypothetical protein JCM17846_01030 [Iodidimonas nitroreducens]
MTNFQHRRPFAADQKLRPSKRGKLRQALEISHFRRENGENRRAFPPASGPHVTGDQNRQAPAQIPRCPTDGDYVTLLCL